jgi:hypothetical protein
MGFLSGLFLALVGVLGAANLIIARKPQAQELIGKIAPYQGWIGAGSAVWGAWGVLWSIMTIGVIGYAPLWWLTGLAAAILQVALGLLLGVGVLKTFIKSEQANAKLDQTITKLAPYQGTFGVIAICLGVWTILCYFLFAAAAASITATYTH